MTLDKIEELAAEKRNPSEIRGAPGRTSNVRASIALVCFVLLCGGCSVAPSSGEIEQGDQLSQVTTPQVTEVTEGTEQTGITEQTEVTETTEALAPNPPQNQSEPEAAIRFEGGEGVRFSGVCSVGETRNVLTGEVPKRFEFRLGGYPLECNIENQSGGTLRVVLVADGDTRSVQQTDGRGGMISVSYDG